MEEQGLAMMAGGGRQPQGQGIGMEEVIQMLMQGTQPEELIQMGIPEELVIQAIQILKQQIQGQREAPVQDGLAGMATAGNGLR